jgi:hypothetical protein
MVPLRVEVDALIFLEVVDRTPVWTALTCPALAQVHCMTQQWRRRIDFAMDTNGSARDQTALIGYKGDDYRMHAKHRAM